MFKVNLNPYVTGKLSKKEINNTILAALLLIYAYSVGAHYVIYSLAYAIKVVLMGVTAYYGAKYVNLFYYVMISEESYAKAKEIASQSKLTIMSLLLALVLPVGTPLWVLFLGVVFMVAFSKLVLIDTGKHITNPVIFTRVILFTLIGSLITVPFVFSPGNWLIETVFNSSVFSFLQVQGTGVDTVSGATALNYLGNSNYLMDYSLLSSKVNWIALLFGVAPGAIGEGARFLIIILGLYLIKQKIIDWIVPATIIGVVFLYFLVIGLVNGYGLWYPFYQVLSGALIFAAFFIATDPYTSPKENVGKFIYGFVIASILIMVRLLTPYPEGVMFSILIGGILSPLLIKQYVGTQVDDGAYVHVGITDSKANLKTAIVSAMGVFLLVNAVTLGAMYFSDAEAAAPELSEYALANMDNPIQVLDSRTEGDLAIYTYLADGKWEDSIKVEVAINTTNDTVEYVNVLSHEETPGIGSKIVEEPTFLAQFVGIDASTSYEVEIISGATLSSKGVGTAVKLAIETYQQ